jgi:hypothetical protein
MRKFLFIVGVMIFSSLQYSTATTVDSVLTEVKTKVASIDTSSVSNKLYNDGKALLKSASESLKIVGEDVLKVLVAQARVYSISVILIYITCVIVLYFLFKRAKKYIDEDEEEQSLLIISYLGSFASLIFFFATILKVLTGLINPYFSVFVYIKELIE